MAHVGAASYSILSAHSLGLGVRPSFVDACSEETVRVGGARVLSVILLHLHSDRRWPLRQIVPDVVNHCTDTSVTDKEAAIPVP